MPAGRVAREQNGACATGGPRCAEQFCQVAEQWTEVAVDRKGLALGAVAPRRWIEHDAVVGGPAADLTSDERPGVFADPADRRGREPRSLGVAAGQRRGLLRGIDVHDLRAGGGKRQRGSARVGK